MRKIKKVNNCVECSSHVPAYQNYLCEKCWKVALNEKLDKLGEEYGIVRKKED